MILKWRRAGGPSLLGLFVEPDVFHPCPKWIEREILVPERAAIRCWLDVERQGRHHEGRVGWLQSRPLPISEFP
jgi:hypothetical protein